MSGRPGANSPAYLKWVNQEIERDFRLEVPDMGLDGELDGEMVGLRLSLGRTPMRMLQPKISTGDIPWQDNMLCPEIGLESFARTDRVSVSFAKQVCALCFVRSECLNDALTYPRQAIGVRGGLTASERRRLKRQNGTIDT